MDVLVKKSRYWPGKVCFGRKLRAKGRDEKHIYSLKESYKCEKG
jgi:hypothetical protein